MPMLDAYIPEGALTLEAEVSLMSKLTDILLKNEGADPSNAAARSLAWVFLHRPVKLFVAGRESDLPRYRIVASVPEGQLDDASRMQMVKEVTDAVLDAEPPERTKDKMRVWVFTQVIPEGTWGGNGTIRRLKDIATFVLGDAKAGAAHARKRLLLAKAERDTLFE